MVAAEAAAREAGGLATTGIFAAEPGTVNTMAHTVRFTLDVRHVEDAALAKLVARCEAEFARVAAEDSGLGCAVEWEMLVDSPAVRFHPDCIAAVEASAAEVLAGSGAAAGSGSGEERERRLWRPMISGAGHDSCYTNLRVPTSMIFTPTREGISHNPTEFCSAEDCALGADVLLGAVLRYDKLRARDF